MPFRQMLTLEWEPLDFNSNIYLVALNFLSKNI